MIAKESGGNFVPAPEGTHLAICFSAIAIGTQPETNSKYSPTFKIMLLFELPNERIERDGKSVPQMVQIEYTLSLNEKSTLRAHLSSWRGRQFTAQELEGFEVSNVVGAPALVTITLYETMAPKRDVTGHNTRPISGAPVFHITLKPYG